MFVEYHCVWFGYNVVAVLGLAYFMYALLCIELVLCWCMIGSDLVQVCSILCSSLCCMCGLVGTCSVSCFCHVLLPGWFRFGASPDYHGLHWPRLVRVC